MKKYFILVILLVAFLVRIVNLPQLVTFGGDQGIDLLVVKEIVLDHRLTLLGPKTSMTDVYNGPLYYYLISPVLWLTNMNPLSVSYFMIILWVVSFYLVFKFGSEYFKNFIIGLYSATIFSLWPTGIEYSRMAFSSFPTPLFSIAFIYTSYRYLKFRSKYYIFGAGLLAGLLMQLHYTNLFLILFIYAILLMRLYSNWKIIIEMSLLLLGGFILTFLPVIVFELRHDFFNTRMFLRFLENPFYSGGSFQLHYLISSFPILFLTIGYFIYRIQTKLKFLGIVIFAFIVFLEVTQINFNSDHAYTMPSGWNYLGVEKVTESIISDVRKNEIKQFNIASLVDGDTRAHPFRYMLAINNIYPQGVEQYSSVKILYVVGKCAQDILKYPVWEIQVFLPGTISQKLVIQNNYCLFRLTKDD